MVHKSVDWLSPIKRASVTPVTVIALATLCLLCLLARIFTAGIFFVFLFQTSRLWESQGQQKEQDFFLYFQMRIFDVGHRALSPQGRRSLLVSGHVRLAEPSPSHWVSLEFTASSHHKLDSHNFHCEKSVIWLTQSPPHFIDTDDRNLTGKLFQSIDCHNEVARVGAGVDCQECLL